MIIPDTTYFYQLTLFLLLWIILTPLLFKPMLRMFEKREQELVTQLKMIGSSGSGQDAAYSPPARTASVRRICCCKAW